MSVAPDVEDDATQRLLAEARAQGGKLVLRSATRFVICWPAIDGHLAFSFVARVLAGDAPVAAGAALGELVTAAPGAVPALWGRAAVVATRLAEASRFGAALLDSEVVRSFPGLPVGDELRRLVGKETILTCTWGGELPARFTPSRFTPSRHEQLRAAIANAENRPQRVELIRRLDALASLAEGREGEALASLRAAVEVASDATSRCRASLAYAIALASVGRDFDALLEAMNALARAREGGDRRGERACLVFVGDLAHAGGQTEALAILNPV
jgi:hypothetical protein